MQPRALWVASHHAELQGKLPGNWGNLLDGVDQLLIKSINDDSYAKARLPTPAFLEDRLHRPGRLVLGSHDMSFGYQPTEMRRLA